MSEPEFHPGDRVRYKLGTRGTGMLVRRAVRSKGQDRGWMVRWDNRQRGKDTEQAYTCNLEPIEQSEVQSQ